MDSLHTMRDFGVLCTKQEIFITPPAKVEEQEPTKIVRERDCE